LKNIHIGHHFYGSGNIGDDFMLAGFLQEMRKFKARISCCSPYSINTLAYRFPEIEWMPYTSESRDYAIKSCDVWLGLGGSPFQASVSDWFTQHLVEEAQLCANHQKPMYFLGIGGQDEQAYAIAEVKAVLDQSERVWVRDETTLNLLNTIIPDKTKVVLAEDLAHIYFQNNPLPPPKIGRLSVTLNFDYKNWPTLENTLKGLEPLKPIEHVWLIQETRSLIGAEKWLYSTLSTENQKRWYPVDINQEHVFIADIATVWPSSEWVLTSRFHTTLASAWAGSKIAVIATNLKLSSVAKACGIQSLDPSATPTELLKALLEAQPVPKSRLMIKAHIARQAVNEFATLVSL